MSDSAPSRTLALSHYRVSASCCINQGDVLCTLAKAPGPSAENSLYVDENCHGAPAQSEMSLIQSFRITMCMVHYAFKLSLCLLSNLISNGSH